MTNPTLALASKLIEQVSITPDDANCQKIIIEHLSKIGFQCEIIQFGKVKNLWAKRRGTSKSSQIRKTFLFAGHTDVVPPGPLKEWTSDPFKPTIRNGRLYGRGAADMKSSLAAFVVATEELVKNNPNHFHDIAFLITSDEEGDAIDGTKKALSYLSDHGEKFDYCIVGEPSSKEKFGDTIKNGRRGSMSGKLTIIGRQGHIAYPHLAKNPIHMLSRALVALSENRWGGGNEHFPPTSWQASNIHGGTGVGNVIPGTVSIDFNLRFSSEDTPMELQNQILQILKNTGLKDNEFSIEWTISGLPFLTKKLTLPTILKEAILKEINIKAELSTDGGTSDGRFIAQYCPEVVEFGPCNATIHQINEHIDIKTIEPLKNIYRRALEAIVVAE